MAVQTDSGVAVSITLGADDGEWLLRLLLRLLLLGSLGDGSLVSCCFNICFALPDCISPSGAILIISTIIVIIY
jgi:hypothetical protein